MLRRGLLFFVLPLWLACPGDSSGPDTDAGVSPSTSSEGGDAQSGAEEDAQADASSEDDGEQAASDGGTTDDPDGGDDAVGSSAEDGGAPDELDSGAVRDASGADGADAGAESDASSSVDDAGGAADAGSGATWGSQPCDQESDLPGCADQTLALCICRGPDANGGNAFCCTEQWDYLCVDGVASLSECKFVTNKCCESHPTDGCEEPAVEQCVCDEIERLKQVERDAGRDPSQIHDCCHEGWSDFCTILADVECSAGCTSAN